MTPHIARAEPADLPFIMATERLHGYDALVGRWDESRHRAALGDPAHAYFIARDAATNAPLGFAIVRDWNSAEQVTLIKRIAMANPGQGAGQAFLRALLDRIFTETQAHRVWLGVFPDNTRARRAYARAGLREEGVARGSAYFGGIHRDEMVMAILRPDWAAGSAPPKGRAPATF